MRQQARNTAFIVGLCGSLIVVLTFLVLTIEVTNAAATSPLPVATQFVYPVGDPDIEPSYGNSSGNGYAITQGFNTSCDPSLGQGQYYDGYYFCGHTGVDLGDANYGGAVRATAAGQVVYAGLNGTYGNMVRIEHLLPDGSIIYSQYEHCGSISVWEGEIVASGQQIGVVGASGFALGPHLHFEIKDTNSDGPGYTFGNAALLVGFYDPLAFVAAHMVVPTQAPVATATAVLPSLPTSQPVTPSTNSENAAILGHFMQQYHYFVTVNIPALRLRAGPSLKAKQVSIVTKNARLALLGVSGSWLHVALPGNMDGWVYSTYVHGTVPAFMRQGVHPGVTPTKRVGAARTVVDAFKSTAPSKSKRPVNIRRLGPLAEVVSDGVHVRQGPGLDDDVLFQAYHGSMVAVRAIHVSWAQVTFTNGVTGWILLHYLRMPSSIAQRRQAAPDPVSTTTTSSTTKGSSQASVKTYYVWAPILNLRATPQLTGVIVALLARNSRVRVLGTHVSWSEVRMADGATGWVLTHYIKDHPENV